MDFYFTRVHSNENLGKLMVVVYVDGKRPNGPSSIPWLKLVVSLIGMLIPELLGGTWLMREQSSN